MKLPVLATKRKAFSLVSSIMGLPKGREESLPRETKIPPYKDIPKKRHNFVKKNGTSSEGQSSIPRVINILITSL